MSVSYYAILGCDTVDWSVNDSISLECTASILKATILVSAFQTTMQCHNSEIKSINLHQCDSLKSYKFVMFTKFSEG